MKHARYIGAVSLLAVASGGVWYMFAERHVHAEVEPRVVHTARAEKGVSTSLIAVSGVVESASSVMVSAKTQGSVVMVGADVGDVVERGATVARIDDVYAATALDSFARTQAALDEAKKALTTVYDAQERRVIEERSLLVPQGGGEDGATSASSLLTSVAISGEQLNTLIYDVLSVHDGVKRYDLPFEPYLASRNHASKYAAETSAARYQTAYAAYRVSVNTTVLAGKGTEAELKESMVRAQNVLLLGIQLLQDIHATLRDTEPATGYITHEQLAAFTERTTAIGTSFDGLRTSLDTLATHIRESDIAREAVKGEQASKLADIDVQHEAVRAQQRTTEQQQADTYVTMPFHGVIAEKLVNEGAFVQPGTPLFRVFDESRLRVALTLPDALCGELAVGTAIEGNSDVSSSFAMTVERVFPDVDPVSHTCSVRARLDDVPAGVRVGSFIRARIPEKSERGVHIPSRAIVARYGETYVYVVQSGVAQQRMVTLRGDTENGVVVAGLDEGEIVVTDPPQGLRSGDAVTIAD